MSALPTRPQSLNWETRSGSPQKSPEYLRPGRASPSQSFILLPILAQAVFPSSPSSSCLHLFSTRYFEIGMHLVFFTSFAAAADGSTNSASSHAQTESMLPSPVGVVDYVGCQASTQITTSSASYIYTKGHYIYILVESLQCKAINNSICLCHT